MLLSFREKNELAEKVLTFARKKRKEALSSALMSTAVFFVGVGITFTMSFVSPVTLVALIIGLLMNGIFCVTARPICSSENLVVNETLFRGILQEINQSDYTPKQVLTQLFAESTFSGHSVSKEFKDLNVPLLNNLLVAFKKRSHIKGMSSTEDSKSDEMIHIYYDADTYEIQFVLTRQDFDDVKYVNQEINLVKNAIASLNENAPLHKVETSNKDTLITKITPYLDQYNITHDSLESMSDIQLQDLYDFLTLDKEKVQAFLDEIKLQADFIALKKDNQDVAVDLKYLTTKYHQSSLDAKFNGFEVTL